MAKTGNSIQMIIAGLTMSALILVTLATICGQMVVSNATEPTDTTPEEDIFADDSLAVAPAMAGKPDLFLVME